jgi:hypothetical protein
LQWEKRASATLPNMDSHFIDQTCQSLDIQASKLLLGSKPQYDNRSPAQSERHACVHDAALFLRGDRRLLLLLLIAS